MSHRNIAQNIASDTGSATSYIYIHQASLLDVGLDTVSDFEPKHRVTFRIKILELAIVQCQTLF